MYIYIVSCIHHDMFLQIQDDDRQPPTPPPSSPARWEGRNANSSPAAQGGRSRSSSFNLTPSPRTNRFQRSPTRAPLTPSGRSNIPRPEGNAQQRHPVQPPNAIASSSQVSGHQAPPPPATTSTSRTKGKTAPAAKRRKKNW